MTTQRNTPSAPSTASPAAAPVIRWTGGKRRVLPTILAARPARIGRYVEPFVGAGAVVLALPHPASSCFVSDANRELVALHRTLATEPELLVARLRVLDQDRSETAFLRARALDPEALSDLERAARLVVLQGLGFNGLYRVNREGRYNVAYGFRGRQAPSVCHEQALRDAARRLRGVTVVHGDFEKAVAEAGPGDFVYLDPPYVPASPTAISFASYTANGFGEAEHRRLANTIGGLVTRGVRVMLSNSDTPLTRQLYARCGLTLHNISVRRSVSRSSSSANAANEVIGLSYPLEECVEPVWDGAFRRQRTVGQAAA